MTVEELYHMKLHCPVCEAELKQGQRCEKKICVDAVQSQMQWSRDNLRDQFALMAMMGLLSQSGLENLEEGPYLVAFASYAVANAMIDERRNHVGKT